MAKHVTTNDAELTAALADERVQKGAWIRNVGDGGVWVVDHLEKMPDTIRVWLESTTEYQPGTKLPNSIYVTQAFDVQQIVQPGGGWGLARRAPA